MFETAHRIDDFEIIRPLGKGGMGMVYEAQQMDPPRRVALKVLAPWLAQDEDALNRFRREVEVLAQLDHPGIVHVISTGRTPDGIAYYTMKLIRGISLAELIRTASNFENVNVFAPTQSLAQSAQETPSAVAEVRSAATPDAVNSADRLPKEIIREYVSNRFLFIARIGIAAARAIHAAHEQGHLHRDIKSSNMMIDHHGQLYVVDFGLTRALDPGADISRVVGIRGTPWYMSPEQARGDAIDRRSDLYSLGVTLYELATCGTGPFTANREDADSVLTQVRAGMHLPLRVLAPTIPREMEKIILKAIQLKAKRRYQNAAELADDLERILPTGSSLLIPPKSQATKPRRLGQLPVVLGVVALVVAFAMPVAMRFIPDQNRPSVDHEDTTPESNVTPQAANPDDYLEMLRNPPLGTAVPLLKADMTPVWTTRPIFGDGYVNGLPDAMTVSSPQGGGATVIALADSSRLDPTRPWFEFSIELRSHRSELEQSSESQIGVFWAYRKPLDPNGRQTLFVAQVDEKGTQKHQFGLLNVGTSFYQPGELNGPRGAINSWMRPLPMGMGLISLPEPSKNSNGWRVMRLKVLERTATITVDDTGTIDLAATPAIGSDPWLKGLFSDFRGQLGIWVASGKGSFRNAQFMAFTKD